MHNLLSRYSTLAGNTVIPVAINNTWFGYQSEQSEITTLFSSYWQELKAF